MSVAKSLGVFLLILFVGASLAAFGMSVHNIVKLKDIQKKLRGEEEADPGVPPLTPPVTDFLPEPFTTKNSAHVHVNGHEVSFQIPGLTDKVAIQGFLTARIPYDDVEECDENDDDCVEETTFRVRLDTEMWVAENDERFRTNAGPTYEVLTPIWPEDQRKPAPAPGLDATMFAKVEFSKPLAFDRPVHNLTIGVTLTEILDDQGNAIGFYTEDGHPRADMIMDIQW